MAHHAQQAQLSSVNRRLSNIKGQLEQLTSGITPEQQAVITKACQELAFWRDEIDIVCTDMDMCD